MRAHVYIRTATDVTLVGKQVNKVNSPVSKQCVSFEALYSPFQFFMEDEKDVCKLHSPITKTPQIEHSKDLFCIKGHFEATDLSGNRLAR